MKGIKKCLPDLITGAVLLLFLLTLSIQMSAIPKDSRSYPKILMILSYVMVIALIAKNLLDYKKSPVVETQVREQIKVILPYAAIIIVYLFLLDKIGYIIDTFLFCMVSLTWLKLKNKIVMAVLSVVMTLALYFLFTRFLSVILPRGSLFTLTL
ncbi:MAG: tripartite tricarboxylate transporter TctB family protein [Clostridium sp.]|nr:tripartite tricarboxylate transporter TctB family protein [Clostridium sp.]